MIFSLELASVRLISFTSHCAECPLRRHDFHWVCLHLIIHYLFVQDEHTYRQSWSPFVLFVPVSLTFRVGLLWDNEDSVNVMHLFFLLRLDVTRTLIAPSQCYKQNHHPTTKTKHPAPTKTHPVAVHMWVHKPKQPAREDYLSESEEFVGDISVNSRKFQNTWCKTHHLLEFPRRYTVTLGY